MYLSTFKKNEYLTSTCTWYILGYLVYLSTWSTVLDPNPADDVTLLSQSIRGMNYMLEVFKSLAEDNCIIFNSKKTVCV